MLLFTTASSELLALNFPLCLPLTCEGERIVTQRGHFVIKLSYFGRDPLHLAACYWLWLKMSREIQDAEINKIYIPLHVF